MPSQKPTTISTSFFPNSGFEDERLEESEADFAVRKGFRNLAPDDEDASTVGKGGHSGPSTRRSSVTAVGEVDEKSGEKKRSAGGGKKNIILIHFEKDDPEDPMNYSLAVKWRITALLCGMTLFIGLSTSAYSSTIDPMTQEFGVSSELGQVGMFTFNAACAIAPLFLAPLCELVGRREVYLSAYFCFCVVFLFLSLGQNVSTQIVGRLFSGLFGSCGTILVGGTLADIWNTHDRSVPMSCFTFVAIFGTIAAPTYCGYISQYAGWRWIEWVHMIANGILFILEIIFLRETRGAKILARRAAEMRKEENTDVYRAPVELESESIRALLKNSSTRAILLLVREPVLFFFGIWIALAWGITFLFLSVIPLTFAGNHGWSEGNAGLPYISLMIGCFVGFGTGFWADAKYNRMTEQNGGVPIPEYRLWGAMFFAGFLPIGLYIFAFTQYAHVHWIAPIIALVPIILGIYHIFLSVYNYTSDSYGELSSSAIAGQGFLRNMFGAATPLFANYMFKGMGYQYAGLLLALLCTLLAPLPFVLFKYGERIRKASKYACTEVSPADDEKNESSTAAAGVV